MKELKRNHLEQEEEKKFPGYPHYPEEEDIFDQEERIEDERVGQYAEENKEKSLDDGLDIPGGELDDEQEKIGSEDEENNYYSLGGDNHDDLEEREDI